MNHVSLQLFSLFFFFNAFNAYTYAYCRWAIKRPVLLIKKRERKNSISKESRDKPTEFHYSFNYKPTLELERVNTYRLHYCVWIHGVQRIVASYDTHHSHGQNRHTCSLTLLVTMSRRIDCIYNAYARIIVNKGQAFNWQLNGHRHCKLEFADSAWLS